MKMIILEVNQSLWKRSDIVGVSDYKPQSDRICICTSKRVPTQNAIARFCRFHGWARWEKKFTKTIQKLPKAEARVWITFRKHRTFPTFSASPKFCRYKPHGANHPLPLTRKLLKCLFWYITSLEFLWGCSTLSKTSRSYIWYAKSTSYIFILFPFRFNFCLFEKRQYCLS